ncbi:DUF805 domain-containing protein, partial [Escherichia sp. WS575]|uniref:DUF805 domain-containing protein n=1 Tax=Escherichia sp. WS575 TaxID=3382008 RepID=UPI00396F732F
MDWYLKVLKNYVGFRGRARRKEYWMFILVNIIFTFVLGLLDKMLGWQRAGGEGILTTIYGILVFLPWWAVGFAPIFPDTCYHLTHYWLAAVDIPVASDNPVHYADA